MVHTYSKSNNIYSVDMMLAYINIYKPIRRDLANYIYPYLAIQARGPLPSFLRYVRAIGLLGLAKHIMFYVWVIIQVIIFSGQNFSIAQKIFKIVFLI